jgi:hypothetical protein
MRDAMHSAGAPAAATPVPWIVACCQRSTQALAYALVLCLALSALAAIHWTGISIEGSDRHLLSLAVMALLALVYRRRQPTMQIADLASYGILWNGYLLFAGAMTYAAASTALPLQDASFAALDASLGFDWLAWATYVEQHPLLDRAFALVYPTIFPQVLAAIIYFSVKMRPDRNDELWWTAALSLVVTTVGFALLPGLGAGIHFDKMAVPMRTYLPDLLNLRDSASVHHFSLLEMQGLITMPSYHAVLAVIIPIALRGLPTLFWGALLLNGFMLFSLPSEGSHYLCDIVAGVLVALASSWCVQRQLRAIHARRACLPPSA